MADNNFRAYRSRDAVAPEDADPAAREAVRDPLAELARLIGQSDPASEFGRNARQSSADSFDDAAPAAGLDWAADDGYAEPNQYAEDSYAQPRLADPYPSPRTYSRDNRDDEREPSVAGQYSGQAENFDDARDNETAYDARYRDEDAAVDSVGRQLPALAPQSYDDEADDQLHDDADGQSYTSEQYDDESASGSRRGGLVVVLAVLGLVMVGAAGAFAYRAMFGNAILPSLPPIIKASDGPNKIIPAQAGASSQAGATNPSSGEKLVSREEQPVQIQPPNAAPRVVATIPVLPAPSPAPVGTPASNPIAPAPTTAPVPPPAPAAAAAPAPPPAPAPAPAAGSTEPKKVHTVTIRPDQLGSAHTAAAASAPAAGPKTTVPPVAKPSRAPKAATNAPLSIMPVAQGDAPAPVPPHTQVARTEAPRAPLATGPATAPSAGGYTVQVTSQRSEAEAQAAFKSLRAKFPKELGNHEPVIRRADLGTKGTYYRALVGPFASMEEAAGICSNLKAAGGTCLVQRN
jgi:hypothetical protein